MAHRSSAASLHAARVLLKHFSFTPKPGQPIPGLLGTEAHISVVLDHATNAHLLAELRPRVNHMIRRLRTSQVSAGEVATFIRDLIEKFESVPRYTKNEEAMIMKTTLPAEFYFGTVTKPVEKSSREGARFLFFYFEPVPLSKAPDKESDFLEITRLIELSIGVPRALEVLPMLRQTFEALKGGQATEKQVRLCLRETGIQLAYLPNYGSVEEVSKLLI